MPASSSPPPTPHRIAILMSRSGRFLQCRNCKLTFEFPAGTHFDEVAKQFESQVCRSSISSGRMESSSGRDA